jgi:hypothetical protein
LFLVGLIAQPTNASGAIINALLIAFQAMAGVVLLTHTRLTTIRLYDGQMRNAFQSLCWGCLLALPPALFNIASLTAALMISVCIHGSAFAYHFCIDAVRFAFTASLIN